MPSTSAVRDYGEVFRELMERAGEKPDEVWRAAKVGRNTYYDVLNDERKPRKAVLEKLAEHFGYTLPRIEELRRLPGMPGGEIVPIFIHRDTAARFAAYVEALNRSPSDALAHLLDWVDGKGKPPPAPQGTGAGVITPPSGPTTAVPTGQGTARTAGQKRGRKGRAPKA